MAVETSVPGAFDNTGVDRVGRGKLMQGLGRGDAVFRTLTQVSAVAVLIVLGAIFASLLIGILVTYAVALDISMASLLGKIGMIVTPATPGYSVLNLTIASSAQILPYVLLILVLIFRPKGLMGKREG